MVGAHSKLNLGRSRIVCLPQPEAGRAARVHPELNPTRAGGGSEIDGGLGGTQRDVAVIALSL